MVLLHQNLSISKKVIFERVVFNPPLRAPGVMDNEACFIFPLEGRSTFHGEYGQTSIMKEESVLMNCGRFINNWHYRKDGENNDVVVIHLYPDVIKSIYADKLPSFLKSNIDSKVKNVYKIKTQEAITNYIKGLIFYFENPQLADDHFVKLKLREFLFLLHKLGNSELDQLVASLFSEGELEFREVIYNNLYEPLSLSDLSFMCNLSLSSFKRKFKETFDSSPAKFIRSKKLEKASELLKNTDYSVTEICYETGFTDPKLFSKNFKLKYGSSPLNFRKLT